MNTRARRDQTTLDPVLERVLTSARSDAQAQLEAARADAVALLESAQTQASGLLEEARRRGAERAGRETARTRSAARRQARADELSARRAIYDAARNGVARGILALRDGPDYQRVREGLETRARRLLGPNAEISEDPAGGIVTTVPGRRVDLSLRAVAARSVGRVDERVASLWTE